MTKGVAVPTPIRVLALADCLNMKVSDVAAKWDLPHETLYNWIEELGGVTYLREVHAAQTVAASAQISMNVAERIAGALETMTEDNLVSLALKVLDVANRPSKGGEQPLVTFNNNPTAAIQQNSEATPNDDQVLGIVAALAESGALTEAMARFIHPEAETTDGD